MNMIWENFKNRLSSFKRIFVSFSSLAFPCLPLSFATSFSESKLFTTGDSPCRTFDTLNDGICCFMAPSPLIDFSQAYSDVPCGDH